MATSKIINELNKIFNSLKYKTISSLSNENFKILILDFFLKVNKLKEEGLSLNEDLRKFIDNKHIEYYDYYENNPIYEERMQMILSELIAFCSPPRFWDTPFDDYMMLKWGVNVGN